MLINKSSLKRVSKLTADVYEDSAVTVPISYEPKTGYVMANSKCGIFIMNANRYYSPDELYIKIYNAVQKRNLKNIISILK